MRSALVLLLAACGFERRLDPGAQGDTPAPDAAIDAPDARELVACPTPPAGCQRLTAACLPATSCYFRCTTDRNWEDARVRCVNDGLGCLVTLDDAAENACLAMTLNAQQNNFWIGYRQTNTTVEPAAGWTWTCGTSKFAPAWGPPGNEPNDSNGNEDCALVRDNVGRWNDVNCDDDADYVCELVR